MRQAVVIIHGIGEQRPMDTLRAFVTGVLNVSDPSVADETDLMDRAFSKPDRISDTLELRRLSVTSKSTSGNPNPSWEADFYELYWQHLMQGTTWGPVLGWMLHVLLRPRRLSKRLFGLWKRVIVVVVMAFGLGLVAWWGLRAAGLTAPLSTIVTLPVVALGLKLIQGMVRGGADRIFLGFLGDAVRYLNPDPPNIEARRAIRTAGLTLLRGLHEDPLRRYDRIILVGHSLGSVIAYDLITWFWQEQHHLVELEGLWGKRKIVETFPLGPDVAPGESPLTRFGDPFGERLSCLELKTLRKQQHDLWRAHRKHGLPWRITDLITLGSPLAHADVLLADNRCLLEIAQRQREFPTCPPQLEDGRDHGLLCRGYGRTRLTWLRILHHGAPFAVTRWTNLYFPGDIVGGPLAPLFGKGIKDQALDPDPKRGCPYWGWRSHVHYWDPKQQANACKEVRKALERDQDDSKR